MREIVTSKVTSKGEVTLPSRIRWMLGIGPGDVIVFAITDDGMVVIRPVHRRRLPELAGVLPATRPYPGSRALRDEVGRRLGEAMLNAIDQILSSIVTSRPYDINHTSG